MRWAFMIRINECSSSWNFFYFVTWKKTLFSCHPTTNARPQLGTFPCSSSAHHNLWQFLSAVPLSSFYSLYSFSLMISPSENTTISCFSSKEFNWNSASIEYAHETSWTSPLYYTLGSHCWEYRWSEWVPLKRSFVDIW